MRVHITLHCSTHPVVHISYMCIDHWYYDDLTMLAPVGHILIGKPTVFVLLTAAMDAQTRASIVIMLLVSIMDVWL